MSLSGEITEDHYELNIIPKYKNIISFQKEYL